MILFAILASLAVAEGVLHQQLEKSSDFSEIKRWPLISTKPLQFPDDFTLGAPIICPGGIQCPAFATCCQIASGDYGCCPFPEAVCCSDKVHCCPSGNQCDMQQQRCTTSNGHSMPFQKRYVWPDDYFIAGKLRSIKCGDQQSECPDNTTCCQMTSGDYGCCQFAEAVCCSDKQHCCPKDSTCNLREKRCERSPLWMFVSAPVPVAIDGSAQNVTVSDTVCPDMKQHCTPSSTCCPLKSGTYGCCPFDKADCCTDGLHCCPQGFKCDLQTSKCSRAF